ncbi:hypothetical protein, partial [Microcoleus sp. herbarium14]|uniref:hypothetical protein n=1 Tax=Microcoleus sp. herbarium14 TaxID=3055439 RepID=UPI002FCF9640
PTTSASEPVAEIVESIEHPQPEAEPVVKNLPLKKKQQPSSNSQPEQPPVTKKRPIEKKLQDNSDDPKTPPAGDSE